MADTWVWVPAFQVTVNGQDLDQKDQAKPIEVVFNDNVDAADFFSVRLGLVDNAIGKPDWIDDPLYKEGGKVRIKMGHEHRALKTMIEGEITAVEVLFSSSGPETLILQGYDRHHRLRRGRKSRTFQKMTDWDIAQKIAGEHGLSLRGDPTSGRYEHIYQNNLSDFDFLMQRAARLGYEVEIENKTLYFRKSQEGRSKITTLKWGDPDDDEVISFSPRLSTANQVNEVTVRGWNPKEKKEIVGRARVGDETTRMGGTTSGGQSATSAFGAAKTVVVDHPIFDQREADALAKARFNELSLSYITGDGICIGNPDIRAGQVVEIKGFGRRFSGLYYVVSSNHVCGRGAGGYRTEFSVRRSAAGGDERAAAAAASVALAPPAAAPAKKAVATTPTAATAMAADDAGGAGAKPAPTPVAPMITLAAKVVALKKAGGTAARKAVTLKTDSPFDGKGTFQTSSKAIRFFTASSGGKEITFNGTDNVFTGAQLTAGVDVHAEAASGSAAMDDVRLTLGLTLGSKPVKPPAKATMTSVELTLDICKSRTKPATDPLPMGQEEKLKTGRFVQVQDGGNNAGRALLIVRKAKPAAFNGDLVLTPTNAKIQVFAAEAPGGAVVATPFVIANSAVPAGGHKLWVQGAAASTALRDTGFTLGVKDVEPEGDRVAVTAVSFTKIEATIQPTPANTARAGFAAPAEHVISRTSLSEDFALNLPLVLMRNAQPNIQLQVLCTPAGLPIVWQAIRNPADHASLGGAGAIPTVTAQADVTKATLNTDQKGSFRVRAFIDCNDTKTYGDREPSIPLNLVLTNATVVSDNSKGNNSKLTTAITGAGVVVTNGAWPAGAGALTAADLANAGMAMELIADVAGGGADGRLGLDFVFAGLVNNLREVVISAEYRDTTVAPSTDHRLINLYVSNTTAATGSLGGTPLFTPGDPAPAPFTWPLLDTGRSPEGLGGDGATMTRSGPHTAVNRPVGQRWTIRCVDSPGRGFPRFHPVNGSAELRRISYRQRFTANFCFWTNLTKSRARSGDPVERTYSVLRIIQWEVVGDWNVNYSVAPPVMLTAGMVHAVQVPSRSTVNPIDRAQDHGVEVRPPSGIASVIAWDGR